MSAQLSQPLCATIHSFGIMSGMKRGAVLKALDAGAIRGVPRGRKTLVDVQSGFEYIEQNPDAATSPAELKDALRAAAKRALQDHAGDEAAWREAFIGLCSREMLIELFKPWQKTAAADWLRAAAKPAQTKRDEGARGVAFSAARWWPSSRPSRRPGVFASSEGATAARKSEARNLLQSFMVNGKPVAEVTALEAAGWVRSHRRDARFVELLIFGVPENSKIGDHRTPQEAEALYAQAMKEAGNV
jgi:hypothetical protein